MTINRIVSICFLSFLPLITHGQASLQNIKKRKTNFVSTNDYSIGQDSLGNANYVLPFLNYYSDDSKDHPVDKDNGQVSQMYAALGCYKQALNLIDSVVAPDSASIAQINEYIHDHVNQIAISPTPISYIAQQAGAAPITMINEAHDYPYHRAFVMSLLPVLRPIGYKYLAMETLTNSPDSSDVKFLRSLSQKTGYYINEPVFGELVRYALELGYTLIPYEFTPTSFTPINPEDTAQFTVKMHERDSLQALNLIKATKKYKDGKILVLGGYAHTLEAVEHTGYFNPFYPMALYFKQLSKTDPFTISQLQFSKTNNGNVGGIVYNQMCKEGKVNQPICTQTGDTIIVGEMVQKGLSDIYAMLPQTTYVNARPTWLTLNGLRKRYPYTFPKKTMSSLVLIQAYYLREIQDQKTINQKVPADQLMLLENNTVDFYLRPGFSYLIVCRDVNNNIVYKKEFKAK
jgi:hypothetical protein